MATGYSASMVAPEVPQVNRMKPPDDNLKPLEGNEKIFLKSFDSVILMG